MNEKTSKNGDSKYRLEPDQLKTVVGLTLQNDERIERLWDIVVELKLALIEAGLKVPDAQKWQETSLKRAQGASIQKMQQRRLRTSLGLD